MRRHIGKILLILLILIAFVSGEIMRRYVHNTGMTSLRVDDFLPGSFVEHSYRGTDYLWRGFVAFAFDSSQIIYGRGADSHGLFTESNYEFGDTLIFGLTRDSRSVYFYNRPIFVDKDVRYRGDTAIAEIETVYVEIVGDEYLVSFSSNIIVTRSVGGSTIDTRESPNRKDPYHATALRKLASELSIDDNYHHRIDTLYNSYSYNVYVSAAGDSFFVPPDVLPRDTVGMGIFHVRVDSAYSTETWIHQINPAVRLFMPPDTLPAADTARARLILDPNAVEVWQYTYRDTITGAIYNFPPRIFSDTLENLVLIDSSLIISYFKHDTIFMGTETINCFGDISRGVYIRQHVKSDYRPDSLDSIHHIPITYTIFNTGDGPLKDTRIMFFFDYDFTTVYPLMMDDMANFQYDIRTVFMHDYLDFNGLHMGFAFKDFDTTIFLDDSIYFGVHEGWYSTGRTFANLKDLVFYPSFHSPSLDTVGRDTLGGWIIDTNAADWGIYAVINIPEVPPKDTLAIEMALLAGYREAFFNSARRFRGDTTPTHDISEDYYAPLKPEKLKLVAYPNPFNSRLTVELPADVGVRIFDIRGREMAYFPSKPYAQSRRWNADNLASGVYMIIPDDPHIRPIRTILIK